jgi:excisionase family DNA binding protein
VSTLDQLLDELTEAAARRAAVIVLEQLEQPLAAVSEFLTIPETAELLRCSRQRVDDLLSQRRLPRVKDGSRTLLRRADVLAYLADPPLTPPLRSGSTNGVAQ